MDDTEAIERVRGGDREAFRLLVERHQAGVFAVLRGLMPGVHDREDLAQETFLAAFEKLHTFDATRGSFRTWLLTIARNRARNAWKRQRPTPLPGVEHEPAGEPRGDERPEGFERLDRALAGLPPVLRATFVLAEIHELTYEEVARIERVPLGTVKSRVHRAREKLRTAMARGEAMR